MVRILAGKSWKLNPSYMASLRAVANRSSRFSPSSIIDVFQLEIDGVNISQGMLEAPIFRVTDHLVTVLKRLGQGASGSGQVSINEDATELVIGRRGASASLCFLSLGRPSRVMTSEIEIDWDALVQATVACSFDLVADLKEIDQTLGKTSFIRRLLRGAEALLATTRAPQPDWAAPATNEPFAMRLVTPVTDRGLNLEVSLSDDQQRIDGYRLGGELFSLLATGTVLLQDESGNAVAAAKEPPFLLLTELVRVGSELMAARSAGDRRWTMMWGSSGPRLTLDLVAGRLTARTRTITCPAFSLARAFFQAALDFGAQITSRNGEQTKNPYLNSLVDDARERLERLRELESGNLVANPNAEEPPSPVPVVEAPLGSGTLKRLRFQVAWSGVDTGGKARSIQLDEKQEVLAVLGSGQANFIDHQSGAILARYEAEQVTLAQDGALVSNQGCILGLNSRGQSRFLRDLRSRNQPVLTGFAGTCLATEFGQPATLCLFDGHYLAAMLTLTGRVAWQFNVPQAVRLAVAAQNNRVYVAADNGSFYALDAAHGQVIFRMHTGCAFEGPVTLAARLVASVGHHEGATWITVLDSARGLPRLMRPISLKAPSGVTHFARRICVGGVVDNASVVGAYSMSGREVFRTTLGTRGGTPAMTVHAGRLYCSLPDGSVSCLDANGRVVWSAPRGDLELEQAIAPVVRRSVLIAAGEPVRALDPTTGALLCALPSTRGLCAIEVSPQLDVITVDDDGLAARYRLATHLSVL